MMTPMPLPRRQQSTGHPEQLAALAARLPEDQQLTLIRFAEFLLSQMPAAEPQPLPEPEPIPRPAQESVVKAMRRLSATYFMLERSKLLNEASSLMAQHVMQGRPATEVIDDLEALFAAHYQRLRENP